MGLAMRYFGFKFLGNACVFVCDKNCPDLRSNCDKGRINSIATERDIMGYFVSFLQIATGIQRSTTSLQIVPVKESTLCCLMVR